MDQIIDIIINGTTIALAVVGGASLIVQGLAKIAAITPSTRDDEILSKVQGLLATTTRILDKVALNLPAAQARK